MPWTEIVRRQYCQEEPRYASDVTDPVRTLIELSMPAAILLAGRDVGAFPR